MKDIKPVAVESPDTVLIGKVCQEAASVKGEDYKGVVLRTKAILGTMRILIAVNHLRKQW